MLHFTMNMPFVLMAFYGSLMIIIVLLLRALLKRRLPKFVFPILWCVVLIRLLVPFSISSPLSIKATANSWLYLPDAFTETFLENFRYNNTTASYSIETEEQTVYEPASAYSITSYTPKEIIPGSVAASTENEDAAEIPVLPLQATVQEATDTVYMLNGSGDFIGFHFLSRFPVVPVYFIGLFVTIAILLIQKYRCHVRLKNRLLIEHNETINEILREMNMGHILVFTNDEIASPLVCGLLTPRIYLPTRMDFRNAELLQHILAHETMHIKRRDNLIKAVMLIAICTNWFNPLIWLMSKCLSSDLEAACDEAVIRRYQEDGQRKSYAFSLLAMAITGNRTPLLYSAFSKTEVEKRIQNIISYKKAPVLLICATVVFILGSSTVFATGPLAPFSPYLTSYCSSSAARWGVKTELARDISPGSDSQNRAENIIFKILRDDTSDDPTVLEEKIKTALSEEFNVEKSAFLVDISLCISDEERDAEYAKYELIKDEKTGFFLYKGEPVRTFADNGYYQSRQDGTVDITVLRDRKGYITSVSALHEGDDDYDRRSRTIDSYKISH